MGYDIYISQKPIDGREIVSIDGIEVVRPIQIHSSIVVFAGRRYQGGKKGDAIVTDSKNLWVGVLTADCYSIFVIAKKMVAAVHAGWRGTLKGITFKTIKYIQTFSEVEKVIIGPGICRNCYEVGYDVFKLFPKTVQSKVFTDKADGKFLLDLKEANMIQIRSAGIKVVEDLNFCTVCNNDRFYSYRKEATDKRILSAIRLI